MSDTKKKSFKITTALQLVNRATENHVCLVDGLLLAVGTAMLGGKPKHGKSTFLRNLAFSVAEGNPFLGRPTQCGDVLFLNLEGPEGLLKEHFQNLGVTEQRGKIHIVSETMPFCGNEGLRMLESALDKLPNVRLVIIDPVAKFLRVADSDKYDQVSLALEKMEQIAKTHGLHLMFSVHHKKRTTDDIGDSPIGSTAFRGGVDTNIFLVKQNSRRVITVEQRWGVAMEPTVLTFDEKRCALSIGNTVESEEEARRDRKRRANEERIEAEILDALLGGSLTTVELLGRVTGNNATVLSILERMEHSGKVSAEKDGKATKYRRVSFPDEVAA